jgi:tetratricopeptide (TPR) repeat protein
VFLKDPLEWRIDQLMDQVSRAGDDPSKRAAALEDYLRFAYANDDGRMDVAAWTETLVESYLVLGRVDEAVAAVTRASKHGHSDAGELLCDLAEKLIRSGHEPTARVLWDTARTDFPDDVWVFVQAGIEYHDPGDQATAISWLTSGVELALRTGDPESALDQLVPLRAACQTTLGQQPDELQHRATRELTRRQ